MTGEEEKFREVNGKRLRRFHSSDNAIWSCHKNPSSSFHHPVVYSVLHKSAIISGHSRFPTQSAPWASPGEPAEHSSRGIFEAKHPSFRITAMNLWYSEPWSLNLGWRLLLA